jgi:hypothetical protein
MVQYFLRSDCSSIAVDLQSFQIRFVQLFPLLPLQVRFIESCCRLVVAVMLVCAACPVSVAVRPACLGSRDLQGTRDTTPVSCIWFCFLPALHGALIGIDEGAC